MTEQKEIKSNLPVEADLPLVYDNIPYDLRYKVREIYHKLQKGNCYYCNRPLSGSPPRWVTDKRIDWSLFPTNFRNSPVHLHHSHTSGLTIGVVHSYCNAVLWQYENE